MYADDTVGGSDKCAGADLDAFLSGGVAFGPVLIAHSVWWPLVNTAELLRCSPRPCIGAADYATRSLFVLERANRWLLGRAWLFVAAVIIVPLMAAANSIRERLICERRRSSLKMEPDYPFMVVVQSTHDSFDIDTKAAY